MTRQWAMYAQHRPDLIEKTGREFQTFGNERYVRMHGDRYDIVEVVLTEDDEGDYFGWIATGRDTPTMIQPGSIYRVQFPYGPEAEEERGKGETVRLSVAAALDFCEGCGEQILEGQPYDEFYGEAGEVWHVDCKPEDEADD